MSVNREARQTEDQSTPEVTVVMPTYNHGLYIGNAISSVLAQTIENFELIVVDNNSIDNTKEIIQQFNDRQNTVIYVTKSRCI